MPGLIDKLPESPLGLKGKPGPIFESVFQKSTSDIQALSTNNNLKSSQDMILGRTYGKGVNITKAPPSRLDLGGQTPKEYTKNLPK